MADLNRLKELLLAASEGNFDVISQVEPEYLNACNDEGNTMLMTACANGKEQVVRHLLKGCANTDTSNAYGWTALMQACYYGHSAVVGVLLDRGVDVNRMNSWGVTPLLAATQSGSSALVKMLIQHGASVQPTPDSPTHFTPLMAAAQNGLEGIAAVLLNHSANTNVQLEGSGYTALMLAALNGHISLVRLLLKHGADKDLESSSNQKAVAIAGAIGREDIARLLGYSRGTPLLPPGQPSLLIPDEGSDIFTLVQTGDRVLRRTQRLLSVSPSVVQSRDTHGATPLMYAAMKGSVQTTRLLVDHGAEVNAQDHVCQWTAFMQAVHHGQYVIAKLLIDFKANVTLQAKDGSTAAEIATCNGDMRMLHLIMRHGDVGSSRGAPGHGDTNTEGNTHESLQHWMAEMNKKLGNSPTSSNTLLKPDAVHITPRASPAASPLHQPSVPHPSVQAPPPPSSGSASDTLHTIPEEDGRPSPPHPLPHPLPHPVPPSFSIAPAPDVIVQRVSNAFRDGPSTPQSQPQETDPYPSNHPGKHSDNQASRLPSREEQASRFPSREDQASRFPSREEQASRFPSREDQASRFPSREEQASRFPSREDQASRFPSREDQASRFPSREEQASRFPSKPSYSKSQPSAVSSSSGESSHKSSLGLGLNSALIRENTIDTPSTVNQDTPSTVNQDTPSTVNQDTPSTVSQDASTVFKFPARPNLMPNMADIGYHDNSSVGEFLSSLANQHNPSPAPPTRVGSSPDKPRKAFRKRVEEFTPPANVEDVLQSLDLQQYMPIIEDNEIDLETFLTMTDEDLQDIGIEEAAHRLKLLNTILKLNRGFSSTATSDRVPVQAAKPSQGFILL